MKNRFEEWMKRYERKKPNTAYQYAVAIDKISRHYSEETSNRVDIYNLANLEEIKLISKAYSLKGRFSEYGKGGNGTVRNAIATYCRYLEHTDMGMIRMEKKMKLCQKVWKRITLN